MDGDLRCLMKFKPESKTLYRQIGLASLIMMASVFLSRAMGLVREMVIAHIGGRTAAVDAYQVAFVIPEILNHIVASGFLSVTFIPIFAAYLAQDRESTGWNVFSVIMTSFGALLVVLIAGAEWFAPDLVAIFAPGLTDPATRFEAVRMTRIILPAQFFFFAGGMLMAVQFAKEKFFIPALAPLIYNFGIIAGGLALGGTLGMAGFSWGVLAGAIAGNFLMQWHGAKRVGMIFSLRFDFLHPDLKKYVLLTLPLMVGLTMTFSTEIFLRFFGSYLPGGGIAALNYSFRVMLILMAFFGQAVGVASFPFLARLAAQQRMDEVNRIINTTLRYLSLVIPFSVLFMVLRHEIIRILFQHGSFDAADTEVTAGVFVFILAGASAFAAQTIVVRGYYAIQNTLFPAIYGTITVLASIPVFFLGMTYMGASGVAMAVSVSAILQVLLLYILWNRKTDNRASRTVYAFYLKIILLSAGLGIFMEYFRRTALAGIDPSSFSGSLITAIITGVVFLALIAAAGSVFGIREITDLLQRVGKKAVRLK